MDIKAERKKVNKELIAFEALKKNITQQQDDLDQLRCQATWNDEAQQIAQHVAQSIQKQAHTKIAGVVTKCLQTIFTGPDEYGFKIHFERKRGRTEARLVLTKNGNEIDDPLNSDSGGVIDVAAFALRLACIVLAKPKLRHIILLDEPFKFVSEEYRDNVRLMLDSLSEDFNIQFIMVTHIKELETGKLVRL